MATKKSTAIVEDGTLNAARVKALTGLTLNKEAFPFFTREGGTITITATQKTINIRKAGTNQYTEEFRALVALLFDMDNGYGLGCGDIGVLVWLDHAEYTHTDMKQAAARINKQMARLYDAVTMGERVNTPRTERLGVTLLRQAVVSGAYAPADSSRFGLLAAFHNAAIRKAAKVEEADNG